MLIFNVELELGPARHVSIQVLYSELCIFVQLFLGFKVDFYSNVLWSQ